MTRVRLPRLIHLILAVTLLAAVASACTPGGGGSSQSPAGSIAPASAAPGRNY